MRAGKHWAAAREDSARELVRLVRRGDAERAVLIDDVHARFRAVVWLSDGQAPATIERTLVPSLQEAGGAFFSGDVWFVDASTSPADGEIYERAWELGQTFEGCDQVRCAERPRTRQAWFERMREPAWVPGPDDPAVVAFYSVKGGVGRTTALAAFALQRANQGERVCVIDFDLDAPGIGRLLAADDEGTVAPWGTVDYLLERPITDLALDEYLHRCPSSLTGEGEIRVIPAGIVDDDYLTKLARIDLDSPPSPDHPLLSLLDSVRTVLRPHWILIDVRAGLSPAAGLLLGGFAHLYVLFGTTSEQSWLTLRRVLSRLGAERVLEDVPQADCLLVQAMVPDNTETASLATAAFRQRAEEEFAERYYAAVTGNPERDEKFWTVDDMDTKDAPHVPVALPYRGQLAFFRTIGQIQPLLLADSEYRALGDRILARFSPGEG
jgi:hypothetical protein